MANSELVGPFMECVTKSLRLLDVTVSPSPRSTRVGVTTTHALTEIRRFVAANKVAIMDHGESSVIESGSVPEQGAVPK